MIDSAIESRYLTLSRNEWAGLKANSPIQITEDDIRKSQGLADVISRDGVEEVYFPLARLINLHYTAHRDLRTLTQRFLNREPRPTPFLIGLAGSVAVGKSSAARLLRILLSQWPQHPNVQLITTDGFLYDNATLKERGIFNRKGFPESYDTAKLIQFVRDIASGTNIVEAPVYSHVTYDIVPDSKITLSSPDIVIIEGLNVLQQPPRDHNWSGTLLSSFFDFSIFVDADENDIRNWYVERFLSLRNTAFSDPNSYFHHYESLSDVEAGATAVQIWESINAVNLRENILPTRENASLILHKDADHSINTILLRK